MTTAEQQRALRRRRRRERQAVVFGSLLAGLAIVGLGAAAVYTDVVDVPFLHRDFTTPAPTPSATTSPPPCPSEGALPVAYDAVGVQVLNATDRRGLAGATSTALTERGFTVTGTGNATTGRVEGVAEIRFGPDGVDAAYTLAAHVPDATLVLERRDGPGVDLVLGEGFSAPVDQAAVALDPAVPLEAPAGCVPLEDAVAALPPAATPAGDETPVDGADDQGGGAEG